MITNKLPLAFKHASFVVLAAAALSGCVRTDTTMFARSTAPERAQVSTESVAVYYSEESVPVRYREVALIKATGSEYFVSHSKMVNEMKERAAKLGANGIIVGDFKDPSALATAGDLLLDIPAGRKGEVLAIYLEEDAGIAPTT